MREVVEARAAPAAHVAHSVVQEAAVRPGAYHQLAACTGDHLCLNPPSEKTSMNKAWAAHVAHSVVQEAAVRPGAYHQLAACTGDQSCPPSENPA